MRTGCGGRDLNAEEVNKPSCWGSALSLSPQLQNKAAFMRSHKISSIYEIT